MIVHVQFCRREFLAPAAAGRARGYARTRTRYSVDLEPYVLRIFVVLYSTVWLLLESTVLNCV